MSKDAITRLSDDEAFSAFVAFRFSENDGEPFCPWCGHKEVYAIATRRKWKCAAKPCRRQFSATSGTIFASRKLSYRKILKAVCEFVNAAKGLSAIRMSMELEVSYRCAFVLKHKFREALGTHQHKETLRGALEIDGAYFGGHIRPRNKRVRREDRRSRRTRNSKHRCVVIMRERGGRSRAFAMTESEAAAFAPTVIEPGSIIYTDQAPEYNRLAARYVLHMVNHSEHYADGHKSTNWAESYFSRLRRMENGTFHHIAGPYIGAYANEASWREDNRRQSNLENFRSVLEVTTHHGVSRQWKGYWQRRKEAA